MNMELSLFFSHRNENKLVCVQSGHGTNAGVLIFGLNVRNSYRNATFWSGGSEVVKVGKNMPKSIATLTSHLNRKCKTQLTCLISDWISFISVNYVKEKRKLWIKLYITVHRQRWQCSWFVEELLDLKQNRVLDY